nr:Spore coat protein like [Ipomoea batatas]GME19592.1 Spore coat protein like [Ipomoea batatas]
MASNLEPVPVTSQKHDPAWKHCQMYKNGDRVQLKCIYCGKVFKGGGIHRIKEHLAGQKGNASTCLRVQPDVRLLMQESLNGAAMKKRKKQKLIDEMMNTNSGHPGEAVDLSNQCELSTEVGLLPVPDTLEQSLGVFESQEEGMSSKLMGRKKKGRIRKASSSGNTNMLGVTASKQVVNSTRMNDQVHMAIARFLLDAGIPFEAVKSSYFQPMIDVIASQEVGIAGPSYHELRSWILKNSIQELRSEIDQCSGSWRSGWRVHIQRNPRDPLLRLLRIVGSEKRSAMGYVYAGLYRAKEIIKKELADKNDYSVYWNIIDHRWHLLQRHPLHAAGFYLNPRFFYSTEEDVHLHLRSLVYDCIERLVPDPKIQDRIVKETTSYKNAAGDFGRKMAVRARETLLPGEWWATYGGGCPNLSRLAIRILSQTEQKNREQGPVDPISYENIELVKDWVSEKELCSEEPSSSDWMAVDPPLGNTVLFAPAVDDFEALGAGFGDYEIFDGVKDIKDENGEDTS